MAQPKSGTRPGMTIEAFARSILKPLIKDSVGHNVEYGGVIYRWVASGKLGMTGPFEGDSPTHVDVRVWAPTGKTSASAMDGAARRSMERSMKLS